MIKQTGIKLSKNRIKKNNSELQKKVINHTHKH